jgi:plastocyanin
MSGEISKKESNIGWYVAAVVVTVVIIAIGILSYELSLPLANPSTSPSPTPSPTPSATPTPATSPTPTPTTSPSGTPTALTLYAGSVTSGSGTYGYGNSSSNIVSPGPTLTLKVGTTYTMTVYNVANIPHSWEIVSTKAISSSPLFGAGIDITNFIPAGGSGSITFTPDQAGNFYYVCTVPGHIDLGMWGNVVVTS